MMGRESRIVKERVCRGCTGVLYATAKTLVKHSVLCKRAAKVGLVLPASVQEKPRKPDWA